ncbi:MAG: amidohydrolase family protein [Burkholderiales bacterium]
MVGRRFVSIACAAAAIGWLAAHARAQTASPLFDGHLHYSVGATQQYSPEQVIEILDRAGIHKALLSSTPNDGTVELYRLYPQRFIPELRPYRKTRDLASWSVERGTWYRDPATATFIENELAKGIYRGIGEFHLNGDEAGTPVVRRIVELARDRGLWLHAHCDALALEKLFSVDSGARILWAHAGMSEPVATVGQMMARYPTLSADLSYRDVAPGGLLDAGWRELFEKYPDRFVYGSDTWIPPRWEIIEELASDARTWLRQLPDHIADRIRWGNAERFFGSSKPERHQ